MSITATIPNGDTKSAPVDLESQVPCAIMVPVVTGTAITFEGNVDGGNTTYPLRSSAGTAYTLTADGTAAIYTVDRNVFAGVQKLRVVSDSAEGAEREFTLITLPVSGK